MIPQLLSTNAHELFPGEVIMDLRKLKKLIDLVEESGIGELEITEGEEKVRISKSPSGVQSQVYSTSQPGQPVAGYAAVPAAPQPMPALVERLPQGHVVKSPMVGTFYRSSAPGANAFVEGGADGERGRYPMHYRSDEASQRDRV